MRKPVPVRAVILAGLPKETLRVVEGRITGRKSHRKEYRVFSAPSESKTDVRLYGAPSRERLIRLISEYVVRSHVACLRTRSRKGRHGGPLEPAPSEIFLLYVPSRDMEKLLCLFDFFAFPVPLGEDLADNSWRHDPELTEHYADEALTAISSGKIADLSLVRERVPSAHYSALKLPPVNFHFKYYGDTIGDLFRLLRSGLKSYAIPDESTPRRKLRAAGRRKHRKLFYDTRERFYPPDLGHHGLLRTDDDSGLASLSASELQQLMNGLYRFGHPLTAGFHFDVQRDGEDLNSEEFRCSNKGIITVSGSHANVYPNDYVRAQD